MLRKTKKLALFSLGLLAAIPLTTFAAEEHHVVVTPQCLVKKLNIPYKTLSSIKDFSLIEVTETGLNQLIAAKTKQKKPCGGFINVDDAWQEQIKSLKADATSFLSNYIPATVQHKTMKPAYEIKYSKQANQLISQINSQEMWNDLKTFSSFPDRYSRSDNGVKAANWIKTQVETVAKNNHRDDVNVYFISTGSSYKQPSIVAKVGTGSDPGIVMGAHMDTLSSMWESKPGADDDGSGSMTVLQVAKTLLASGMHFKKPIYFIWYAAEEMGLVGSQYVVKEFKKKHIPVDAVSHFDMTGYAYHNDPTLWLIQDYTNNELTAYFETLIKTYVKQPVKYTACGYACSDHATWTQAGYKAAIAFEAEFGKDDPYIHSAQDTMDVLSLSHMTDYAKLGTAFVVEMAEPA